ncbi:MAG TPA: hypothetical protein VKR59_11755 [Terriglobales bacterium]|nr:hypothetical protein [Terriglobales bacterium]
MSISAVSSSLLNSATQARPTQTPFQADFQQLSKDLQSGNLSAAQTDFATLQKDLQGQGGAGRTNGFHQLRNHHLKDEGSTGSTGSTGSIGSTGSLGSNSRVTEPPIQVGGGRFTLPPVGAPIPAISGSSGGPQIGAPISVLA